MFQEPPINGHWRKSTNESKGKMKQKCYAAFGTIFRIVKYVFKEASTNLTLIFPLNKAGKKCKKIFAHV
jgi:hypothetical protein